MHTFEYHKAASLEQAIGLLEQSSEGMLLAGGQTLITAMKQRLIAPSDLISVDRLDTLKGIELDGDSLVIGAGETHATVAGSDIVRQAIPTLADLAGLIGDPHVRNRGTLGGSIANNDPAADYPAALLALDATVHTSRRAIAAADFFTGLFETDLKKGEIILRVSFPVPQRAGYEKFPNPASRFALVGVFAARSADGSARIAVTGAGHDGVFRVATLEQALASDFSADRVPSGPLDGVELLSDIHADADYRAALVPVIAARAVARAG